MQAKCDDPREIVARAFYFGERKDLTQRTQRRTDGESAGKREDEEAAFAGNDHGEGVAVGRDGEIAKANAVKKRDGLRLRDGNVMSAEAARGGRSIHTRSPDFFSIARLRRMRDSSGAQRKTPRPMRTRATRLSEVRSRISRISLSRK